MRIQFDSLNELEKEIHTKLQIECENRTSLTITQAATLTGVSPSKISKFVKKVGFSGYKDYFRYITGAPLLNEKKSSTEFQRIKTFIDEFDYNVVTYLADLINNYDKIILFGYGPTNICLEYFEYKLTYINEKNVIRATQESLISDLLTDQTLLLVFSVAGKFAQFNDLFSEASNKEARAILIIEELNTELKLEPNEVIYLTKSQQEATLKSHEKTRTILLMYLEEVVSALSKMNAEDA